MWLPRDERRLLAGYFFKLKVPGEESWFREASWIPVLGCGRVARLAKKVPEYGEEAREKQPSFEQLKRKVRDSIRGSRRVHLANARLEARKLVRTARHESVDSVFGVALTEEGYDLGSKYRNWFTSSEEWCKEYRGHWVCRILGFLLRILGPLVVKWLSYRLAAWAAAGEAQGEGAGG